MININLVHVWFKIRLFILCRILEEAKWKMQVISYIIHRLIHIAGVFVGCKRFTTSWYNLALLFYFIFIFFSFLASSYYCYLFCTHFTNCSAPMAFERRNFYRAIPAMIQNLGCHDLVPVTAPFSHLLITTSQVY